MIRRPPRSTQAHHSFPTRRSSDLIAALVMMALALPFAYMQARAGMVGVKVRSEEHTSELQSSELISYAVFCLKKKNDRRDMTCNAAVVGFAAVRFVSVGL